MKMSQPTASLAAESTTALLPPTAERTVSRPAALRRRRWRRPLLITLALLLSLQLVGRSVQPWRGLFRQEVTAATTGWGFDLFRWEVNALSEKAVALWTQPGKGLNDAQGSATVREYLDRADALRHAESAIVLLAGKTDAESVADRAKANDAVHTLRAEQAEQRPVAEAVLQSQITEMVKEAGFSVAGEPWPPVLFTFTESPHKLVISPRSRITTLESKMLDPEMPLEAMEATESQIEKAGDVSALVADTGGLGAFPTMVVDDASLEWILSTIAHEWTHTYLAFFPLGFNYGESPDNTTINETVAEIVGTEIGRNALLRYYPEIPEPPDPEAAAAAQSSPYPADEVPFNFNKAMRETRRVVDQYLSLGRVDDAERYMEIRRQLFAESGYHIRKLNQAWFAFHGSYGTGPAADIVTPDAIAPKLQRLRDLTPDLHTFVTSIRGVVDAEGLDRVLAEWEAKQPQVEP